MRRWRIPLALSIAILLARLLPDSRLIDVVTMDAPAGVHLEYPAGHAVLAPLTLTADWLNGGSRHDLVGFALWSAVAYTLVRLSLQRPNRRVARRPGAMPRRSGGQGGGPPETIDRRRISGRMRETLYGVAFVAAFSGFIAWAVFATRPIPRLVADDPDALIWDAHSHSSASHDGRRGFSAAANARWHARAGFDAAFLTDHNIHTATLPPLLRGEELSLSGLHVIALGVDRTISNTPWNASWDGTLTFLRSVSPNSPNSPLSPFLIASLPEYWRYHWGEDLGAIVGAGVRGFEVWTSSPRGMEIPPALRRRVLDRARVSNLAVIGATDMHGIGYTASVWNVMALPGWRSLGGELEAAIIARLRVDGFNANRVVALRRWLPASAAGQAVAVPVNLVGVLRRTTSPQAAGLIVWIWTLVLGFRARRRAPR